MGKKKGVVNCVITNSLVFPLLFAACYGFRFHVLFLVFLVWSAGYWNSTKDIGIQGGSIPG